MLHKGFTKMKSTLYLSPYTTTTDTVSGLPNMQKGTKRNEKEQKGMKGNEKEV